MRRALGTAQMSNLARCVAGLLGDQELDDVEPMLDEPTI
jgi:hypothetical protein